MDLIDVFYLFSSPASIFVAVVAITFLLHQAWPHLSKQPDEPIPTTPPEDDSLHLTVTKEPEIPDDWWTSGEVFELERRALFSKVRTTLSPNSRTIIANYIHLSPP